MRGHLAAGLFLVTIVTLVGCGHNSGSIDKMEQIKSVGDTDPEKAISMLDSLDIKIRDESEYVQMRYDLLKLRLYDKADRIPNSDIVARRVTDYFESHGSCKERQEACYYAGSVYRDLRDTPRALEYFYKSEDIAINGDDCDSLLLRNTYSQLSFILCNVQDYQRSYRYAKKEYEISKRINRVNFRTVGHLGVSYNQIDSIEKAKTYLDMALEMLTRQDSIEDSTAIYVLLYNYSVLGDYEQAYKCYTLSRQYTNDDYKTKYLQLGTFFELTNQTDSAIYCYKRVIDDYYDLFNVFDASKSLVGIYNKKGDYKEAARYANIFKAASDTLDLGRRQELAATVNNQYQYHLDKEKEYRLREDKERLRFFIVTISITAVLSISLLLLLIIYRKNRSMKKIVSMTEELDSMRGRQIEFLSEISKKKKEIEESRLSLSLTDNELRTVKERLGVVTLELDKQKEELEEKEKLLSDRLEQNRLYMNLLNESRLEDKAEDVIQTLRQSAKGKKDMSPADWNKLYRAVNELYPDFRNQLNENIDKLSEQKMQVCYLIKIGLTNLQIQNTTNLSRVTVWRWIKRYSWILESKDEI